ncbi:MAG: 2OG-Fe(II) oxygenase [Azospirillaceae bacterium]
MLATRVLARPRGAAGGGAAAEVEVAGHVAHALGAIGWATRHEVPWRHWRLDGLLPEATGDALAALPMERPDATGAPAFDGTREGDNARRVFFDPDRRRRDAAVDAVASALDSPALRAALGGLVGVDLTPHHLRVELCRDTDGFWLAPHTDIRVKRFTMLIGLNREPELADAGTDLYDGPDRHWGTAPFGFGTGLVFVPGDDTWHGFRQRPIRGVRQCLIANYVDDTWRARHELASGP